MESEANREAGRSAKMIAAALVLVLVLLAALLLPLRRGIWLPDLVPGQQNELAAAELPSGDRFRVIQYWNDHDFYSVELQHRTPDGTTTTRILDPDSSKIWKAALDIDEANGAAAIRLGSRPLMMVQWR